MSRQNSNLPSPPGGQRASNNGQYPPSAMYSNGGSYSAQDRYQAPPAAYQQGYSGHQYYNNDNNQYYSNNQGWQGQQQHNYETDDYDNLEEIEREMDRVQFNDPRAGYGNYSSNSNSYDEEDLIEAELEKLELSHRHQSFHPAPAPARSGGAGGYSGGKVLPVGATPSQNGILSPHAAEFWFPESRNCPCCKGYKHGCNCCSAPGSNTCRDPNCLNLEYVGPATAASATSASNSAAAVGKPPSIISPRSAQSAGGVSAGAKTFSPYGGSQQYQGNANQSNYETDDYDNLEEIEREMDRVQLKEQRGYNSNSYSYDEEDLIEAELEQLELAQRQSTPVSARPSTAGGYSGGKVLPVGATPSQNGILSPHAAEFWFPDSRNCPCCKGYKHGCNCCSTPGSNTCRDPNCLNLEYVGPPAQSSASNSAAAAVGKPPSIISPRSAQTITGTIPTSYIVESPQTYPSRGDFTPSETCRFEHSPSGCRFGASCRFKHSSSTPHTTTGSNPKASSGGSGTPCVHYLNGYCQFGESCRFSHHSTF